MGYKIDLKDHKFFKLVVKEFVGNAKNGDSIWRCICNCGLENCEKEIQVRGQYLLQKRKKSCSAKSKKGNFNFSVSPTYSSNQFRKWCPYCKRISPHIKGKCSWH